MGTGREIVELAIGIGRLDQQMSDAKRCADDAAAAAERRVIALRQYKQRLDAKNEALGAVLRGFA